MSGHSKWAQIKRKKAVTDAKRGKMFTRLIKEIQIAARLGGPDPDGNPRLRFAIESAKRSSMPADNISRAVARGAGQDAAGSFDELTYEVYGPGGIAILVETATDNKNRTVGEMRHVLGKYGGVLGESGSVSWMFAKKGVITIPSVGVDEDTLMLAALDAGAEDVRHDDPDYFEVRTSPESFVQVKTELEKAGYTIEEAALAPIAANTIRVEPPESEKLMRLLEAIEDNDDVQNVYTNADINE